jgi:glycosyltransferase involved in cell wall biosynthesis
LLPSRREGLLKSLLEATARGRPIAVTDVPGCREIAGEGGNAQLVPPDYAEAHTGAIDRSAAMRARFAIAGRRMDKDGVSADFGRFPNCRSLQSAASSFESSREFVRWLDRWIEEFIIPA